MRALLLVVGCLIALPSFATVAWKCVYNGETYLVSMPCEEALKRGITPPFKERPDAPECADLSQRRIAALAELKSSVSMPRKLANEEIARMAKDLDELELAQRRYGCKGAPSLP